jgi:hypothetical protein
MHQNWCRVLLPELLRLASAAKLPLNAGTIQFIVQFPVQQKLGTRASFIRESKLEHDH